MSDYTSPEPWAQAAWEADLPTEKEHPAHSGHEYGGAYARAAALAAGDPDWMNATGGKCMDSETSK